MQRFVINANNHLKHPQQPNIIFGLWHNSPPLQPPKAADSQNIVSISKDKEDKEEEAN